MLFRECKDSEGNKIFEMFGYCGCEICNVRALKRLHTKGKYVYFNDINKKEEAEKILKQFNCNQVYNKNSAFEEHEIAYIWEPNGSLFFKKIKLEGWQSM